MIFYESCNCLCSYHLVLMRFAPETIASIPELQISWIVTAGVSWDCQSSTSPYARHSIHRTVTKQYPNRISPMVIRSMPARFTVSFITAAAIWLPIKVFKDPPNFPIADLHALTITTSVILIIPS